ncbi:hypothetical protein [Deferribacter desulfuricans]|uniref:hypothetical protein n=1 Tax=Deferribacter desulfuricans TaxID=197162 RepID=UPI0002F0E353|nr:hypothetical protein [Deferribacter desulfuricans]
MSIKLINPKKTNLFLKYINQKNKFISEYHYGNIADILKRNVQLFGYRRAYENEVYGILGNVVEFLKKYNFHFITKYEVDSKQINISNIKSKFYKLNDNNYYIYYDIKDKSFFNLNHNFKWLFLQNNIIFKDTVYYKIIQEYYQQKRNLYREYQKTYNIYKSMYYNTKSLDEIYDYFPMSYLIHVNIDKDKSSVYYLNNFKSKFIIPSMSLLDNSSTYDISTFFIHNEIIKKLIEQRKNKIWEDVDFIMLPFEDYARRYIDSNAITYIRDIVFKKGENNQNNQNDQTEKSKELRSSESNDIKSTQLTIENISHNKLSDKLLQKFILRNYSLDIFTDKLNFYKDSFLSDVNKKINTVVLHDPANNDINVLQDAGYNIIETNNKKLPILINIDSVAQDRLFVMHNIIKTSLNFIFKDYIVYPKSKDDFFYNEDIKAAFNKLSEKFPEFNGKIDKLFFTYYYIKTTQQKLLEDIECYVDKDLLYNEQYNLYLENVPKNILFLDEDIQLDEVNLLISDVHLYNSLKKDLRNETKEIILRKLISIQDLFLNYHEEILKYFEKKWPRTDFDNDSKYSLLGSLSYWNKNELQSLLDTVKANYLDRFDFDKLKNAYIGYNIVTSYLFKYGYIISQNNKYLEEQIKRYITDLLDVSFDLYKYILSEKIKKSKFNSKLDEKIGDLKETIINKIVNNIVISLDNYSVISLHNHYHLFSMLLNKDFESFVDTIVELPEFKNKIENFVNKTLDIINKSDNYLKSRHKNYFEEIEQILKGESNENLESKIINLFYNYKEKSVLKEVHDQRNDLFDSNLDLAYKYYNTEKGKLDYLNSLIKITKTYSYSLDNPSKITKLNKYKDFFKNLSMSLKDSYLFDIVKVEKEKKDIESLRKTLQNEFIPEFFDIISNLHIFKSLNKYVSFGDLKDLLFRLAKNDRDAVYLLYEYLTTSKELTIFMSLLLSKKGQYNSYLTPEEIILLLNPSVKNYLEELKQLKDEKMNLIYDKLILNKDSNTNNILIYLPSVEKYTFTKDLSFGNDIDIEEAFRNNDIEISKTYIGNNISLSSEIGESITSLDIEKLQRVNFKAGQKNVFFIYDDTVTEIDTYKDKYILEKTNKEFILSTYIHFKNDNVIYEIKFKGNKVKKLILESINYDEFLPVSYKENNIKLYSNIYNFVKKYIEIQATKHGFQPYQFQIEDITDTIMYYFYNRETKSSIYNMHFNAQDMGLGKTFISTHSILLSYFKYIYNKQPQLFNKLKNHLLDDNEITNLVRTYLSDKKLNSTSILVYGDNKIANTWKNYAKNQGYKFIEVNEQNLDDVLYNLDRNEKTLYLMLQEKNKEIKRPGNTVKKRATIKVKNVTLNNISGIKFNFNSVNNNTDNVYKMLLSLSNYILPNAKTMKLFFKYNKEIFQALQSSYDKDVFLYQNLCVAIGNNIKKYLGIDVFNTLKLNEILSKENSDTVKTEEIYSKIFIGLFYLYNLYLFQHLLLSENHVNQINIKMNNLNILNTFADDNIKFYNVGFILNSYIDIVRNSSLKEHSLFSYIINNSKQNDVNALSLINTLQNQNLVSNQNNIESLVTHIEKFNNLKDIVIKKKTPVIYKSLNYTYINHSKLSKEKLVDKINEKLLKNNYTIFKTKTNDELETDNSILNADSTYTIADEKNSINYIIKKILTTPTYFKNLMNLLTTSNNRLYDTIISNKSYARTKTLSNLPTFASSIVNNLIYIPTLTLILDRFNNTYDSNENKINLNFDKIDYDKQEVARIMDQIYYLVHLTTFNTVSNSTLSLHHPQDTFF